MMRTCANGAESVAEYIFEKVKLAVRTRTISDHPVV